MAEPHSVVGHPLPVGTIMTHPMLHLNPFTPLFLIMAPRGQNTPGQVVRGRLSTKPLGTLSLPLTTGTPKSLQQGGFEVVVTPWRQEGGRRLRGAEGD